MKFLKFRYIILCTSIIFILHPNILQAQDSDKNGGRVYKSVLTAQPLSFLISTMSLGYEFKTGPKSGLKFQASLTSDDDSYFYDVKDMTGFGLEVQPRFYIIAGGYALNGFYMAPSVSFHQADFTYRVSGSNFNGSASSISVGYVLGYQKIVSGFAMDAFLGGALNLVSGDAAKMEAAIGPFTKGVTPLFGFGIGPGF